MLSEEECDKQQYVSFCDPYCIQIKLSDMVYESHLPRLITDKSTSCASSLGTVDVRKLPPSRERKKQDTLVKHLIKTIDKEFD